MNIFSLASGFGAWSVIMPPQVGCTDRLASALTSAVVAELEKADRALLPEPPLRTAGSPPGPDGKGTGSGTRARIAGRAQGYIEEHFRDAITMRDLCTFAGVGLRTLQRCFAAHFRMSPSDYIKARRLEAAREELISGHRSTHSVTGIALNNGFTHLGRFSVDYRARFAESPRDTLLGNPAQ